MNKFTIALAALTMGFAAFAQDEAAEPNRLFINDASGSSKGFVINHVTDITFARVEGEVKAAITLEEVVSLEELTVSISKTEACHSYILDVIPGNLAKQLTSPAVAINYMNRSEHQRFYDDFTSASLTGINLNADSEYAIITVAYDGYNVADGVDMVTFKTPAPEIEGDPKVEMTVDETTLYSFTCTFTPNDDVAAFYCVAGEKGTMQSQYEMFGPMMNLSNFEQMIISWGIETFETTTKTWNDMAPNTEYEVFVVCKDVNGNAAPYQVFEVSTASLGGDGEAAVSIELGEYGLSDWDGEQKYSQTITFTPNDQASCFRFGVYKAASYDTDKAAIQAELCSDPWMPTAYWFFYETYTTDYQIDPGEEVVAIAAAKNAKGEWGQVTELRFTTPAADQGSRSALAPAPSGKIASRVQPKAIRNALKEGVAPSFRANKGIILR